MKISVIEKTIPKTIPVTAVFMEGSLAETYSNACLNLYLAALAYVKRLFELSLGYISAGGFSSGDQAGRNDPSKV
jgi:hypothetical protein